MIQIDGALQRGLSLLTAVCAAKTGISPSELASRTGLPTSSVYRLLKQLDTAGFVRKSAPGCYVPVPGFLSLTQDIDRNAILRDLARPAIFRLARKTGLTAHLGILENGMVTYVIRVAARANDSASFTREGGQLEAYCSAVGKVLLSNLPEDDLNEYLSDGEFVPLTDNTITNAGQLQQEIATARTQGFALDNFEVSEDLFCVSVPVGPQPADQNCAISVSSSRSARIYEAPESVLDDLRATAAEIASRIAGPVEVQTGNL